jgi:prepilin peptidase CpaA
VHTLIHQPAFWVLLLMVSSAAVTDWRTGLIPNRVVAFGALAGVMVQLLAVVRGDASLADSALRMGLGFLVCSLVPALLWFFGALGGGDLKLFAAIGLCAGPGVGLDIQLWAHLLAVGFLPLYLLGRGNARSVLRNTGRLLVNLFLPAQKRKPVARTELSSFRFAPAILAASLWVCVLSEQRP